MVLLLAALMVAAAVSPIIPAETTPTPAGRTLVWGAFLYGIPLLLAGFLLAGHRWALMGAVMYGTIGLALDLSTVVQEITRGDGQGIVLAASGATGLLNFMLIVLGGRGFLTLEPGARPPGAHPPSPPHPSST